MIIDNDKNKEQLFSCVKIIEYAQKLRNAIETDYGKVTFYDPSKSMEEQELEVVDMGISPSAKFYLDCIKSHLQILDIYFNKPE